MVIRNLKGILPIGSMELVYLPTFTDLPLKHEPMPVKYTRPMDPMGKYIVFQSASFPLNHWKNDN